MQPSWLVLLPTFIVLLSAFFTKKLNLSLSFGIITGALIAADFNLLKAFEITWQRFFQTISDVDNLQMYAFLIIISILVVLLNRTGGAQAFAAKLTHHLRSAKSAQTASFLLSLSLFIDDYLSSITAGYVMRPITDRFHIARAKLAYLVHSMSGPLVMLVPISSWVATITSSLDLAGVGPENATSTKIIGDPFFVYLQSIPYIFYSFFTIASVLYIIRSKISFGPMYIQEHIAHTTGNLFGGKAPLHDDIHVTVNKDGTLADLFVPLLSLISLVFIGSLWVGDYHLFGGNHSFIDALKHNNKISLVLFVSGIISLTISLLFSLLRARITFGQIPFIAKGGTHLILNAIYMIILAATLGKILRGDLMTGQYLATLIHGTLSISLLPVLFFIIATIIAMLTGSSWGTMILLIPIATPMLTTLANVTLPTTPESLDLLFPVLGAIFSGSVCGDHLSPISETTIMAATSAGAYPLDHAQTQFPYAIGAIVCSALGYVLTGYLSHYGLFYKAFMPFLVGMALCIAFLWFMNYVQKKYHKNGE